MRSSQRMRRVVLGSLLLFAAGLAIFGDKTPADDASAVARPLASKAVGAPPAAASASKEREAAQDLLELRPRDELIKLAGSSTADLFRTHNWTPPPPPPGPVVAPIPTAPPLPYTYAGKKQEQGMWEVYLMRGDMAMLVREGSNVESAYTVVAIRPPTMTLKYLPLGLQQTLAIGEAE